MAKNNIHQAARKAEIQKREEVRAEAEKLASQKAKIESVLEEISAAQQRVDVLGSLLNMGSPKQKDRYESDLGKAIQKRDALVSELEALEDEANGELSDDETPESQES